MLWMAQKKQLDNEEVEEEVDDSSDWEIVNLPSNHFMLNREIRNNINDLDDFEFPEKECLDKLGKGSIGIAFSGGGSRSASCTLGQLRGLHALGLIKRTRYFSSVSGSSWALTPFLYGKMDRDYFLGSYPEDWQLEWHHIFSRTSHIV